MKSGFKMESSCIWGSKLGRSHWSGLYHSLFFNLQSISFIVEQSNSFSLP